MRTSADRARRIRPAHALAFFAVSVCALCVAIAFYVQVTHPEMTEEQMSLQPAQSLQSSDTAPNGPTHASKRTMHFALGPGTSPPLVKRIAPTVMWSCVLIFLLLDAFLVIQWKADRERRR